MDYFRAASGIKSSIESLTGQRWTTVDEPEFEKILEADLFGWGGKFPDYEYLVHLRHHGFPSPLLDWSRSPFVAAFFAFHHARLEGDDVAVYAYLEYAGGAKTSSTSSPTIYGLGPHVTTHKRHVLQQAEYTICVQQVGAVWQYAPHESAASMWDQFGDQDLLWKITLPATLRNQVLRRLDSFNLNAFSLFQSEDSLMETMALRAFIFDEPEPDMVARFVK